MVHEMLLSRDVVEAVRWVYLRGEVVARTFDAWVSEEAAGSRVRTAEGEWCTLQGMADVMEMHKPMALQLLPGAEWESIRPLKLTLCIHSRFAAAEGGEPVCSRIFVACALPDPLEVMAASSNLRLTAAEFFTAHRLREWTWLYAMPYAVQGGRPLPPQHGAFAPEMADPTACPPPFLVALLAACAAMRARDSAAY